MPSVDSKLIEYLLNETVEPGDRLSVMEQLLLEGQEGLREVLELWLSGGNAFLRVNALGALLGYLHVEEYVARALELIKRPIPPEDPSGDGEDGIVEILARCSAAQGLGQYAHAKLGSSDEVRAGLVRALMESESPSLQREYYRAFLMAQGEHVPYVPMEFQRDRDVDWSRVKAYISVS